VQYKKNKRNEKNLLLFFQKTSHTIIKIKTMKYYFLVGIPIIIFCVWGIINEIKKPFKK